jgi:hypothetical protein
MLNFTISYPDVILKFIFMNTIEKGVWGWKEAQTQNDSIENVNMYTYHLNAPKTFTRVCVNIFDKYLHCPRISVNDLHLYRI